MATKLLGEKEPGVPYKVLVVDDSKVMRMVIGKNLGKYGFEKCGEAADGKEALEKFTQLKPDIITMDINMPVMGGIESLEAIRAKDHNVIIVMVTTEGQHDVIMECLKKGANSYIIKPPLEEKFRERFEKLLT